MAMQPRNVLYVLFDDLRADYGFGSDASSSGHTPNLDKLSQTGVKFELAFSQVAFCVPSRTSFLTGLRPETTTSVHNDQVKRFRDNRLAPLRPGTTVLDAFKRAGYTTAAVGKIFHFGEAHPSLDLPVLTNTHDLLGRPCDRPDATDVRVPKAVARYGFPRACQLPFGSFVDQRVAAGAVGYLRRLASSRASSSPLQALRRKAASRPFLLLVGFMRPHNPYQFPSQHLDLLPAANATDVATVRRRHESQPALAYSDDTDCSLRKCSREQRRFYRAAVSHADEMFGLVLQELQRLQLASTTLVVVHSDHGFSLGENGAWQKRSNFDHATRVPLLIRDPTLPSAAGLRVSDSLVELVDVLPTMLDLSGANMVVAPPRELEGRSLRPLLSHPANGARSPSQFQYAFMLQPRLLYILRNASARGRDRTLLVDGGASVADLMPDVGGFQRPLRPRDCSEELVAGGFGPGRACKFVAMGFSVRSRRWRYTRWERWPIGDDTTRVWTAGEGALLAEELYCYASCHNLSVQVRGTSANAEQVNLAASWSARRLTASQSSLVRSVKETLTGALLSRGSKARKGLSETLDRS